MSLLRKTVMINEPVSALLTLNGFSISPQSNEDVLKDVLFSAVPEELRTEDTFNLIAVGIVGAMPDITNAVIPDPTKLCYFSCIYGRSTQSVETISKVFSSKFPNRISHVQLMQSTNYLREWQDVRIS